MARFIHWSDLHTEFRDMSLPDLPQDIDALLLAGDTGVREGHLDFLFKAWQKYQIPIISIHGNHEYYGTSIPDLIEQEKQRLEKFHAAGADIRVLHGETTRVNDVIIFGATLWTDYDLWPQQTHFSKLIAQRVMNDFNKIRSHIPMRSLNADDFVKRHYDEKAKLTDALRFYRGEKMIVMTHHLPAEICVHPNFRSDGLTPAFASNLEDIIETYHPDFWIFGHTHSGLEIDIDSENGKTRLRHNPRGYPREGSPFDPYRMIDTENPEIRRLEADTQA